MTPLRSLFLLLGVAAVGGGVVAAVYGGGDGLPMALLLALCGAPVLALAHFFALRPGRMRSLSRKFMAGVALAIGLVLAGVIVVALLMFVSPHDALIMALLLVFAGALAGYSAWLLSHGLIADVRAVREGVQAVGEGRRDVTIRTGASDEISELADAANLMIRQLAERESERDAADKARRDLVAAVSHDLRTPLTSLRLLAEAVQDELVDPATRARYLEQMSTHIRSLSALIEDLFELSRLEAGDIRWSMQQVPLQELVTETVDAMRPHAEARRVAVEAQVPEGVAPARGDPEKLQRVLFNLVQNAIRHTPPDGSVTVAAQANGGSVEIEVADTGSGVATGERDRVFEPFFRGGDGSARSGDGAGLGLAICRAIVEAHGGDIWLAEAGPGTRVRFSLPRAA